MSVILGLGYTFYSGAVEAWLVDALNAAGYRGSLDQVFARNEFISGAAMLVGTVGGGLLGQIDLAIPFIGRSLLLILLFGFAFVTMHDLGYQPRTLSLGRIPEEMKAVAQASLKFGLGRASLRLIFLMSLIQSGFLYWGFYAWQPYFLDLLGQDAVWVAGVIAAFISLATMTGNGLVEWLTRICGKRTTLILWATAIGGLATIGVGLTRSFWVAVILLLVYMATTGVTTPVIHAYMHQVIPSGQRAAILSLNSMVGSGGGILAQAGLGYISRASSIASGYILGGAVSLLVLPVAGMLRRLQEPADVIVGRAGLDSTCAAQGIPEISGLETDTHPAASK
jgi:MFS family permease